MTQTLLQFQHRLAQEVCCSCSMSFALPEDLQARLRGSHKTFYCPAGHPQSYTGKSAVEKAKAAQAEAERETRWAESRLIGAQNRLEGERNSHRSTRGHLTRQKRRAAAGVCPCCRRTFKALARHMKAQHPRWGGGDGPS